MRFNVNGLKGFARGFSLRCRSVSLGCLVVCVVSIMRGRTGMVGGVVGGVVRGVMGTRSGMEEYESEDDEWMGEGGCKGSDLVERGGASSSLAISGKDLAEGGDDWRRVQTDPSGSGI